MPKRINVLTKRGPRSIATYTYEDLNKVTEGHVVPLGTTTITTTFVLTEQDTVFKDGAIQGIISELSDYTIQSDHVLQIGGTLWGGEEFHIVPFK